MKITLYYLLTSPPLSPSPWKGEGEEILERGFAPLKLPISGENPNFLEVWLIISLARQHQPISRYLSNHMACCAEKP
jgi:hypothetical protein